MSNTPTTTSLPSPITDAALWQLCARLLNSGWYIRATPEQRAPAAPFYEALVSLAQEQAREGSGAAEARDRAIVAYPCALAIADSLGLEDRSPPNRDWPAILLRISTQWRTSVSTVAADPPTANPVEPSAEPPTAVPMIPAPVIAAEPPAGLPTAAPAEPPEGDQVDGPDRRDEMDLFTTPEGDAYCTTRVGDHRETHRLDSTALRYIIEHAVYARTRVMPKQSEVQETLRLLEGRARFGGAIREVHLRTAATFDRVFLDLANEKWKVVEVDAEGWRVAATPSARFRRPQGMLPLPMPEEGSVDDLRPFLNLPDDDAFKLVVAWMTAAMRGQKPFTVLALIAEQGSAKSTGAEFIRMLLDPAKPLLRRPPSSARDLMVGANNSWIIAYENLSELSKGMSDDLAMIATGGGFGKRKNYTDTEETLIEVCRPILLNGIASFVVEHDLKDRSIVLHLPPIPDHRRIDKQTLVSEFERARPRILGGLLNLVSAAMRELPNVKLTSMPRMADFARWAIAVERAAGWPEGSVINAYLANRKAVQSEALAEDSFAAAIVGLVDAMPQARWEGTPSELLDALEARTPRGRRGRQWPNGEARLGVLIRRVAPLLRAQGVTVEDRRTGAARKFVIARIPGEPSPPSSPSSDEGGGLGDDASDSSDSSAGTEGIGARDLGLIEHVVASTTNQLSEAGSMAPAISDDRDWASLVPTAGEGASIAPPEETTTSSVSFTARTRDIRAALAIVAAVRPRIVTPVGGAGYLFVVRGRSCFVHSRSSTEVVRAEFPITSSRGDGAFVVPLDRVEALEEVEGAIDVKADKHDDLWPVHVETEQGKKAVIRSFNPRLLDPCDGELNATVLSHEYPAGVLREAVRLTKPFLADGRGWTVGEEFRVGQIFDRSRPEVSKGAGHLFATDAVRCGYFWSEALEGGGLAFRHEQVTSLLAFLRTCGEKAVVRVGERHIFIEGAGGSVLGWERPAKTPERFSYYPLKIDNFVILVQKQEFVGGLRQMRKLLDPRRNAGTISFNYAARQIRFAVSDPSGTSESAPMEVTFKEREVEGRSTPIAEERNWTFKINIDHMLDLVKDVKCRQVELRVFTVRPQNGAAEVAMFRTIDDFRLDSKGRVTNEPEGSFKCRVTRFMSSMG